MKAPRSLVIRQIPLGIRCIVLMYFEWMNATNILIIDLIFLFKGKWHKWVIAAKPERRVAASAGEEVFCNQLLID